MSDITISIPSDPFRTMIKSIISEESLPTLFTRDVVATLIEGDGRIRDEIHTIAESVVNSSDAIDRAIREAIEDSHTIERTIKRVVDNSLDYGEVASNIELSDLATHFSISDLANEINPSDLADEIGIDSLAEVIIERDGINYEKLAKAILSEIRAEATKANTNA